VPVKIEASVVTTKGQLVIPARLRRRFGIKKGTTVTFFEDGGRIIMQPVTAEFIRGLRGSLKEEPSALGVLLNERKRERALAAAARRSAPR
jgi:AbrB family looped-hinge helix DNA binding protein